MQDSRLRIALLIDADNASVATLELVLTEIADRGMANVRRAYGDWGNPRLGSWREALLANAIQPVQQVAYTRKGNASDMAMVIDAMDLLHAGRFDAFALMSSDSDFTPLAMRLRAANMQVYGFGKANTPDAFKAACSVFFHVDDRDAPAPVQVEEVAGGDAAAVKPVPPPRRKTGAQLRGDEALSNLLKNAVLATRGDDGWSNLGAVNNHLANRGSFTPKNYGFGSLKPLIVETGLFEVRGDGNHIRAKAAPAKRKPPAKAAAKKTQKGSTSN